MTLIPNQLTQTNLTTGNLKAPELGKGTLHEMTGTQKRTRPDATKKHEAIKPESKSKVPNLK
jgi:hypothetical protein